jgi:hypothetical protein
MAKAMLLAAGGAAVVASLAAGPDAAGQSLSPVLFVLGAIAALILSRDAPRP